MSDHDVDARLRSWARSSAAPTAPEELRRQVLAIPTTETTTPRRRWRWFVPGLKPTAGAEAQHDPASWSPATTTAHTGGIRSMFSTTKLFAMVASVALLGALAVALPLGQMQESQVPGAESPAIGEIDSFTGGIKLLGQDELGSAEEHDWGYSTSGEQWTFELTTTEPRYSGLGTGLHNVYEVGPDRTVLRVQTGRLFTEDEDGTWLSTGFSYQDPETTKVTYVIDSTGEGVYTGLSAYSICEQIDHSLDMECRGIVFEGTWPELPSDVPDEIRAPYLMSR